jgi:hypothetical protein
MIVHCLSFGTLWWLRPGNDNESSLKFSSEAAVFNTTGFISRSRERRNWIIPGVIRFNLGTCMEQRLNPELQQQTRFFSSGLERKGTQNRLLLNRKVKANAPVDLFLACMSEMEHGRISFDSEWRSQGVRLVAASEFGTRQESLMLLPMDGLVRTHHAEWRIVWAGLTATLKKTA